jgi:hypothetical protein
LVFASEAMTLAMAARLTERLMVQATIARHASIQAPKKAKQAPTAMNMVPSGTVCFCIKGASAVKGIYMSGTVAPARVGKSVGAEVVLEAAAPEVFEAAEEALDEFDVDDEAALDVLVDLTKDETAVSLSVVGAAAVV